MTGEEPAPGASPAPTATVPVPNGAGAPASSGSGPTGTASTPTSTPPSPPSEAWSMTAGGCADFEIVTTNVTKTKALLIRGSRAALGLDHVGASATISAVGANDGVSVSLLSYATPPTGEQFCTDVFSPPTVPPTTYYPTAGTITFTLVAVGRDSGFNLSVETHGLRMRSATGLTQSVPDRTYAPISLGWAPG